MSAPRTIAVVQFSGKLSGSTISSRLVGRALRDGGDRVDFLFGFSGVFHERAQEEGFECSVVEHGNWLRAGGGLRFFRNFWKERQRAADFRRHFTELKPDLVYVNTLVSYAAAKAAADLGIPVIWHLRELFCDAAGELVPPPWLGKPWVARTIRRLSRRTVAPSSAVSRNIFGEESLPTHSLVPNAIDVGEFESSPPAAAARAALKLPADVPIVAVVGTFRPVKGQDVLVRAIPSILRSAPQAVFVFAGYILSFCDEVKRLAAELGVSECCHFLGEVSEISNLYAAADMICIPSRSESFGRSAVEAFAAGRPVVGSRVGGLLDILRDGENSFTFESEDSNGLAAGVIRMLKASDQERQKLVDTGSQDVRDHYSEAAHARAIRSVVNDVLSSSQNG